MKHTKSKVIFFISFFFLGLLVLNIYSCKQDDQVLDIFVPDNGPNVSATDLVSLKVTAGPGIDGDVDAMWDDAQKLETMTIVPDPGNKVFEGYEGNTNEVTLRSLYDTEHIYFLAEWTDNKEDLSRQTWYFDTDESRWKQEDRVPLFNSEGVEIRQAFYEDKFSFLWNVNNSVANWDNATCYTSCHTDVGAAGGFARHYTQPGETIDMWHWKMVRTNVNNQMDDQYQDDSQPNGRHSDTKVSGGYVNNTQDLEITGTTDIVKVPKYFVPNRTYYYWITQSEIDNSTAKLITAVAMDGTLSYDGGTIDPNAEIGFQREGSIVGQFGIPSIYTSPFIGSRGDITAYGNYTGSGWVLEMKRKLQTADTEAQDVDFSSFEDFAFGIAVFDNAGIAHGIKANLLLKFDE